MHTHILKFITILLAVATAGCRTSIDMSNGNEEPQPVEVNSGDTVHQTPLKGTRWKLEGIVDVVADTMKVIESQNCNQCYTLAFDMDSIFYGPMGSCIFVFCKYEIDYKAGVLLITSIATGGCDLTESPFERSYLQILQKIQSFVIKDTYPRILHLYYNDGKNYLKFKKIGGQNEN